MTTGTLPTTPGEGAATKKTTAQQSRFSVVTYLQRLTMRLGLGLGGGEYDDDGAGGGAAEVDCITEEQAEELYDLAKQAKADLARLFRWAGRIETMYELSVERYPDVLAKLHEKLDQQKARREAAVPDNAQKPVTTEENPGE